MESPCECGIEPPGSISHGASVIIIIIREKRILLNNVLRRKANWIVHIQRRNCLLYDNIEGDVTEAKRVGRRTQLFDGLGNRSRYSQLKEEAIEHKKEL